MARPPASAKTFNRFALLLAGRRLMPVWGVLRHSGRKSGREYSTPLAFVATPGAFFVGLPWGRGTDWVRNVRASGRCTVRLRGREYECTEPEFVEKDAVVAAASGPVRMVVQRIDFPGGFLRLRRGSPAGGHGS
jgi:deazaflavin-dependent oxidoreductase (nitroreductase family)